MVYAYGTLPYLTYMIDTRLSFSSLGCMLFKLVLCACCLSIAISEFIHKRIYPLSSIYIVTQCHHLYVLLSGCFLNYFGRWDSGNNTDYTSCVQSTETSLAWRHGSLNAREKYLVNPTPELHKYIMYILLCTT
jgi:hypothetical protein